MRFNNLICMCLFLILIHILPCPAQSRPDTLWTKELKLPNNEQLFCAAQTPAGEFLFGGQEMSSYALWLVKTDAGFDTIWQSIIWDWENASVRDIEIISDTTTMVLATYNMYHCALVKYDNKGDTLWARIYKSQAGYNAGSAICPMPDNGFLIAGQTDATTNGYNDVWLLRVDSKGNPLWEKSYGGDKSDYAVNMIELQDGNYLIMGTTSSFEGSENDAYLLKIDADGDTIWTRYFPTTSYDTGITGLETEDQYIFLVTRSLAGASGRGWLSRLRPDGTEIWKKSFDGHYNGDRIAALTSTRDGGLLGGGAIHHGENPTGFWMFKTDTSGQEQWSWEISPGSGSGAQTVFQLRDGSFLMAGEYYSPNEYGQEILLVSVENDSALLTIPSPAHSKQDKFDLAQNYPNPFNPVTTIGFILDKAGDTRLEIYDILGKKVAILVNQFLPSGKYSYRFNGSFLASGVYYYQIVTGDHSEIRKMVLLK